MQIIKEGFHIFYGMEYTDNEVFLNLEYPVIRYNKPDSLLHVLLKEQDNRRNLYYDITGATSIQDIALAGKLDYEVCRSFLKSLLVLFEDIEEYMLSLSSVSFATEDIYQTKDGRIQFIYGPYSLKDNDKRMEELFLWMLSHINYQDKVSLEFVLRVYQGIKSSGCTRMFLEECLKERAIGEQTEESFRGMSQEKEGEDVSGQNVSMKRIIQIIFVSVHVISGIAIGYLYMRRQLNYNISVCFFVILVLAWILYFISMYILQKKERNHIGNDLTEHETETNVSWQMQTVLEDLEERFEKKDGTVILERSLEKSNPILRSCTSSRKMEIKVFPFYIGSEDGLNQLVIEEKTVSRQHAVINRSSKENMYHIEDLCSTNGTLVDRTRILPEDPVIIQSGSILTFADSEWEFIAD